MPLRIDPRVDFACKRMLGSPDHPDVTSHFLNSLLTLEAPIVGIEILNPLVGKDRSEDKVIVLDILARDSHGRLFNIEMQTRLPLSFANRLLLYNCKNYTRQVREGDRAIDCGVGFLHAAYECIRLGKQRPAFQIIGCLP